MRKVISLRLLLTPFVEKRYGRKYILRLIREAQRIFNKADIPVVFRVEEWGMWPLERTSDFWEDVRTVCEAENALGANLADFANKRMLTLGFFTRAEKPRRIRLNLGSYHHASHSAWVWLTYGHIRKSERISLVAHEIAHAIGANHLSLREKGRNLMSVPFCFSRRIHPETKEEILCFLRSGKKTPLEYVLSDF